jgi:hypothetical protein
VVFGRCPQQGGATDVDLLNGLGQGDIGLGNGLLKGIEVDHHQVKGPHVVGVHVGLVAGQAGATQDAPMDAGVQGFDPPAEDFWGAGVVRDFGDGQPRRRDRRCCTAAADNLKLKVVHQSGGKFHQSRFVRHTQQR